MKTFFREVVLVDQEQMAQESNAYKNMSKISENLGTQAANKLQEIIGEIQQQKPHYQNPLQQQFVQEISSLLDSVRQQQLSFQSQLQESLNQASTNLMDSNRAENILNSANQLMQAAQMGISNLQLNIEEYKNLIREMEKDCRQQQVKIGRAHV